MKYVIFTFLSVYFFNLSTFASQKEVKELSEKALSENQVAGIIVISGNSQKIENVYCIGNTSTKSKIPLTADSIFDMASVTKAVAVSTALAICYDRGLIDLDAPFTKYLPQYKCKLKNPPTVRDLAMHVSGFIGKPYGKAKNGKVMLEQSLKFKPKRPVAAKYEYACWNFILLGQILENITKQPLDEFCKKEIFEPLSMISTSLGKPVITEKSRLVKTMDSPDYGTISDPHARIIYRDGFCAGNAGMFSTANDLAKFCQMMLNSGKINNKQFLKKSFIELTTNKCQVPNTKRSLGWDMTTTSLPKNFSEKSITHSGWSGQTVFIDLENNKFVVVLTVRTGDHKKGKKYRIEIAQKAIEK